jgi:hypothetical protein
MSINGQVTVWHMTEEERLAYIKKHPIKQTKREMPSTYGTSFHGPDYKWRGKKGADSRWDTKR